MMRTILASLATCVFALVPSCNKDDAAKKTSQAPLTAATPASTDPKPDAPSTPLRDKLRDAVPLPPSMPKSAIDVPAATGTAQQQAAAPEVFMGPTKGEDSAETLARALVEAAKKRDMKAFQDLTVSGKDIALTFHKGLQVSIREKVALLSRKFITYTQQIPNDGQLLSFKPGFAVDFQKGQGATVSMPGLLGSEITVKAGAAPKTLPLGRIVQIDGRWKLLDF